MVKDRIIRTAKSTMLSEDVAPQASPIMSDPRFGSRNSALEMVPNDLMFSNMILSTSIKALTIKSIRFETAKGIVFGAMRISELAWTVLCEHIRGAREPPFFSSQLAIIQSLDTTLSISPANSLLFSYPEEDQHPLFQS
jgi:hypothetical protein